MVRSARTCTMAAKVRVRTPAASKSAPWAQIDRGYERLDERLRALGAKIQREE